MNYQEDHRGYLYNYYDGKNTWWVVLGEQGYIKPRYYYLNKSNLTHCPVGGFGAGVRWNNFMSSGFNVDSSYKNMVKLTRPSMFITHADSHTYFFANSDWSVNTPTLPSGPYGAGMAWPHNGSTNILLADGHTEAWTMKKALSNWSNIGTSYCLQMFNYTHNCWGY